MATKLRKMVPALAVAATIALAGCSNPVERLVEKGVESVIGSGTDSEIDLGLTGEGASLPKGWPDVPTPEGRILTAITLEEGTTFNIAVLMTQAQVDSFLAALDGGPYEETLNQATAGGSMSIYEGDQWTLGVIIGQSEEEEGLFAVVYNVSAIED